MSINVDSVRIDGLSSQQITALASLAAGRTVAEVARDFNISRQTVYNWQKEPKFIAALDTARQVCADELRDQMIVLSRKALKRLETLIDDPKSPPTVALKAALAVLNRPQFPEQGWCLPANINTPRQDRIQEMSLAIEIDMKQAELDDLKRKLLMAKIKAEAHAAASVGQNLTPRQPVKPVSPVTPISPVIVQNAAPNSTPPRPTTGCATQ